MNLGSQSINFKGEILNLEGDKVIVQRLREMGFTPGEAVRIQSIAPFGDPLLIQIRESLVALRRGEAECIQVK